jgi:tetratricopeptide (TPR) repeat protein
MAPEQYVDAGAEPGPAVDQYAFCVALWEALHAAAPFSGKHALEAKRRGPPGWTATGVPRPIALAISRGLAADPDARWPDMDSLLAGLSYEPKRRRRRWATAGASIAVVGVMAAGVQSWLERAAARCSGARDQLAGVWDPQRRADVHTAVTGDATPLATDVWTRLEPVLDAYAEQWVEMYTDACEATTVRGEQSAAILDLRMTCLHRANVALEAATRVLSEADPEVVQRAHQIAQGLPPVTRCADVDALQANVEPPLPADATAVDEARSLLARARALDQAGRYDDAQATVAEVTEVLAGVDYGPVQTEVLERLGDFEGSVRRTDEALALATRSRQQIEMGNAAMRLMYVIGVHQHETDLALRYRTLAESATAGDALASGDFHSKLASVLNRAGRYAEAETAHRRALELWMTAVGPDHPHISGGRNNIANVLRSQGKYQEAEQEYRAALAGLIAAVGPEHPAVALMHNNLGLVLGDLGRHEQRVPEHRRALALWEAALGPDHVHVATAHNNLGGALYALGDYAGAEAEFRLAMNTYEKAVGPAHPHTARARDNLGAMLGAQGQWEAAEREHRLALEQREVALGDEHPDVALSASNLALALEAQKDFEGALAGYQRALRIEQAALGAEHPSVADAQSNVGGVLQKLGRYEQAEVALRAGLAIAEEALPGDHDELAHARSVLADLLVDRGRAAEAVPLAEQAWARRQRDDTPPERRAETAFVLARATWAADPTRDGYDRARALATRARRAFREAGGAHTEALAAVDAWLREHP